MFNKIALTIFILFSLIFFWMFRYDMTTSLNHGYRIDRWTGKINYIQNFYRGAYIGPEVIELK